MPIGTLQERSLHAALKDYLARPGDRLEVALEGYVIDIVRGDLLIEVQTGNFSALKPKLARLLPDYQVEVVYPLAQEKWIRRVTVDGEAVSRRKSPKRGRIEAVFNELLRIPDYLLQPHFSLTVLFIQEEEVWCDDGQGSWRRKRWSIADHRLLAVVGERRLATASDFLALLPANLPQPFTNRELAETAAIRPRLAQRMSYALAKMGLLVQNGKRGRAYLYQQSDV